LAHILREYIITNYRGGPYVDVLLLFSRMKRSEIYALCKCGTPYVNLIAMMSYDIIALITTKPRCR